MTIPVSRRSPAPGVFVDRHTDDFEISGALELHGPQANRARARSVQTAVNTNWTASFPDGASVRCTMRVTYRAAGTAAGTAGQIEAVNISGPSHYSRISGAITLNATEATAFTWTAAHEFGHMIGLEDKYSEPVLSRLRGRFGGQRTNTVESGYENNIMGTHQGVIERRNLGDLVDENRPRWSQRDDRVRSWVMAHSQSEVRQVSTFNKISMINILMGGIISRADFAAIIRIIGSVNTATEANRIRSEIDDVGFTSLNQRFQYRAALSHLPR